MADWAKIAIKTGLILVLSAGVIVLLVAVQFPAITLTQDMIDGISFAKSFLNYWVPNFSSIIGLALGVIVFELGILTYKFGVQVAKWLWSVNE